jgi:excinuclease ABC subunit A
MDDLKADGNSVILVDHDTQVLKHADWMIEMGKGAGADGGEVISEGRIEAVYENPESVIGPYLSDQYQSRIRLVMQEKAMFEKGVIHLETGAIHTVHPLDVRIPMGAPYCGDGRFRLRKNQRWYSKA